MKRDIGPPYTVDKDTIDYSHNRDDAMAIEFINADEGDFRLAKGSAAIDMGVALPGINDGYKGKGPDLGAFEYGGEAWRAGSDITRPEFIDEIIP